jgi:hypothetical protein
MRPPISRPSRRSTIKPAVELRRWVAEARKEGVGSVIAIPLFYEADWGCAVWRSPLSAKE